MNYAILPLSIHVAVGGQPWDGWAAPNIWQWDRWHPAFRVAPDEDAERAALGPIPDVEHWAPRAIRRKHRHIVAAANAPTPQPRLEGRAIVDAHPAEVAFSAVSDPQAWEPEPGTGFVQLADHTLDSDAWATAELVTGSPGHD